MINIYRDPMTSADIVAARKVISDGQKLEDSVAFKVFLYCPVPGVDVIAGLATHAIQSAITNDPLDDLRDVRGATDRDWSLSEAATTYVQKVREQGRELTTAEVQALDLHVQVISKAGYAVGVAGELAKKALSDAFGHKSN